MQKKIILASASPRRRELLRQAGLTFTVEPADVDERVLPREEPASYALRVALEKARTAAGRTAHAIAIGADTIVVIDGQILGKPADSGDAERMLTQLSGRSHQVITGIAVVDSASGQTAVRSATTTVQFRKLTGGEIAAYVRSGEPLDKAGAYGIQEKGALLVESIEGCYFNVVGLPLSLLAEMLREFGVRML